MIQKEYANGEQTGRVLPVKNYLLDRDYQTVYMHGYRPSGVE